MFFPLGHQPMTRASMDSQELNLLKAVVVNTFYYKMFLCNVIIS